MSALTCGRIPEKRRSFLERRRRIETERSQGFVRQCFSTRMVFVELVQVGEIFTMIVYIGNERIEFGYFNITSIYFNS